MDDILVVKKIERHLLYKQRGSSLMELLIASSIGIMVMMIMLTIFINGQKQAIQHIKRLLLQQNANSVIQLLKEDVQRAGFNGYNGNSVKLLGSKDVVHFSSNPTLIGYLYRIAQTGHSSLRHVVYQYNSISTSHHQLRICEKEQPLPLSVVKASTSGFAGSACFALFDPKLINVQQFTVDVIPLLKGGEELAISSFITIILKASLISEPSMSTSFQLQFKQRNWQ